MEKNYGAAAIAHIVSAAKFIALGFGGENLI
jgi:hypothetical protein